MKYLPFESQFYITELREGRIRKKDRENDKRRQKYIQTERLGERVL